MLFAILRRDRPGKAELRARLQPDHNRYQEPFLPHIVFGGGMVIDGTDISGDVDIRDVVGNVLIFDAPDRATAEGFHNNDPYTLNDLFETVIIEPFWQRVPPPGIVGS
ncbi:MAG: YciI family protein [Rhodospirillaceae bacterium]|jgi:uncharacterized protein|nr:YciI family protein [Rhodospirillaceae bacterium]